MIEVRYEVYQTDDRIHIVLWRNLRLKIHKLPTEWFTDNYDLYLKQHENTKPVSCAHTGLEIIDWNFHMLPRLQIMDVLQQRVIVCQAWVCSNIWTQQNNLSKLRTCYIIDFTWQEQTRMKRTHILVLNFTRPQFTDPNMTWQA